MTADPDLYLGRVASERALASLERRALQAPGPTALTGPPGMGKTLLLRVLERRLESRLRCVYLPYSSLPPEGLCAWALEELGRAAHANPEAALLEVARQEDEAGRGLLLMVDDASHLPLSSARGIVDLCAETRGAMRLTLAATDGVRTGALLAALGVGAAEVRLSRPMNASETRSYLRHRLGRVRVAPSARARFGNETLTRLHQESGGIPRSLHRLASEWLRSTRPEPSPAEALETDD
jgi:type II secretory pathway predicted ATPase ExeA